MRFYEGIKGEIEAIKHESQIMGREGKRKASPSRMTWLTSKFGLALAIWWMMHAPCAKFRQMPSCPMPSIIVF